MTWLVKEDFADYNIFLVIITVQPYCNNCSAMQSERDETLMKKSKTATSRTPIYLFSFCTAHFKRMIVMTTEDPYCPTCTSLHAPRLPTQRLTSQLCMHDELCISAERTLRNHVMLTRARTNLQNRATWGRHALLLCTLITTLFCSAVRNALWLQTKIINFNGSTYSGNKMPFALNTLVKVFATYGSDIQSGEKSARKMNRGCRDSD